MPRSKKWRTLAVPENPAKHHGIFSGLQEMVSFSAFMGGFGIPVIVLLGLGLILFFLWSGNRTEQVIGSLDREDGDWFGVSISLLVCPLR